MWFGVDRLKGGEWGPVSVSPSGWMQQGMGHKARSGSAAKGVIRRRAGWAGVHASKRKGSKWGWQRGNGQGR